MNETPNYFQFNLRNLCQSAQNTNKLVLNYKTVANNNLYVIVVDGNWNVISLIEYVERLPTSSGGIPFLRRDFELFHYNLFFCYNIFELNDIMF